MSEWLLLRFDHGPTGNVAWMTASESGQPLMPPQLGSLAQLAELASTRRVCALVPASDVTTLEADLPLKAGAKLLQAVPFAVEDQLAENVEDLHFALGERVEGQRATVAAVARVTLDGWLAELAKAGLRAERLSADAALLPDNPGQIVAVLDRDAVLIRAPGQQPMALPSASLADSIELALAHVRSDAAQPGLLVYTSPQDWQKHGAVVDGLRTRFAAVKVQLLPQGPLPLFAQQLPTTTAINLLQGEHAPSGSVAAGFRAWRVAAALAVLLLGLYAGGRYWELSRLNKAESQLDASITQMASAAVPNLTPGRDPRRQVEARLKTVRGVSAGSSGDLLDAVSAFSAARSAAPDAQLEGISYQTGALEVRLKAPAAASIERIRERLQAAGWQATLKGGAGRGTSFEGRLEIRPLGG
jgi:general secretion pathway protein L